jgi:hypothetical protein
VSPPGKARPFNIDLLVSTGRDVWCYEVKLNATGLATAQFGRLLKICSQLGARPGIAALHGEFDSEMVRRVNEARGQIFTGADLVP